METIRPADLVSAKLYLTKGELEVLALMASKGVTIKQVKDAVQLLKTTDIRMVAAILKDLNN